jgi:hypothetical protein
MFLLLQKEIALYAASKANSEFCWFDIDGDIDPLFKVGVCSQTYIHTYIQIYIKIFVLNNFHFFVLSFMTCC